MKTVDLELKVVASEQVLAEQDLLKEDKNLLETLEQYEESNRTRDT